MFTTYQLGISSPGNQLPVFPHLLQVIGELGRQRQKARFLLMAPRFTSGLKFWQIYHNPTWRRKKTLKKRETLEIFNDLNIVKNVKWEASEVFMMLYTMFNGTRLEASIANFTGGYMEMSMTHWQWEQLTDLYRCEFGEYCVCAPCFQNLSDVFFTGYPCVPMHFQAIFLINTGDGSKGDLYLNPICDEFTWKLVTWIITSLALFQRAVSAVAVEWSCRRQNSSWTSTGWWPRQDLCPLKISRALFFTAEEDICVQMSISLLKDQREPSRQCLCGGSPRLVTG